MKSTATTDFDNWANVLVKRLKGRPNRDETFPSVARRTQYPHRVPECVCRRGRANIRVSPDIRSDWSCPRWCPTSYFPDWDWSFASSRWPWSSDLPMLGGEGKQWHREIDSDLLVLLDRRLLPSSSLLKRWRSSVCGIDTDLVSLNDDEEEHLNERENKTNISEHRKFDRVVFRGERMVGHVSPFLSLFCRLLYLHIVSTPYRTIWRVNIYRGIDIEPSHVTRREAKTTTFGGEREQ